MIMSPVSQELLSLWKEYIYSLKEYYPSETDFLHFMNWLSEREKKKGEE